MFLGHFAVAFAAKTVAPQVSLGTLFMAAQLADLLWPVFFLLGLETFEIRPGITAATPLEFVRYPYSHSLVALLCWAAVVATAYVVGRGGAVRAGGVLAAVVLSHWVLDVIAHRPDMPITIGGSARLGLGLWQSIGATVLVESLLFAAGVVLYLRTAPALTRRADIALWSLIGFLIVIYVGAIFGPPPSTKAAVPAAGFAMWLLVAWAHWADRSRRPPRQVSA